MKKPTPAAYILLTTLLILIAGSWTLSRHQLVVAEQKVYKTSQEKLAELRFSPAPPLTSEEVNEDLENWRAQTGVEGTLLKVIPSYVHKAETPKTWKAAFLHTILPNAVVINDLIRADRDRFIRLSHRKSAGKKLSQIQKDWMEKIALLYRVEGLDHKAISQKLDEIPLSMLLAQAANESAWGRSRFAREGNALFGQWTWGSDGIIPSGRPFGAKYRVKSFESIAHSIHAYMLNINTHAAYEGFRTQRAEMRASGQRLDAQTLIYSLNSYSERGGDYPKELMAIIRVNKFDQFDGMRWIDKKSQAGQGQPHG